DRIRAALRNAGFDYPQRRVTVNLAPAGVRKEGAHYDLAIALGILAAEAKPPLPDLAPWCVLGELGLDGRVHGVRGALPIAAAAKRAGLHTLLVPAANAAEAALAGPAVIGIDTLAEAVAHLRGELPREPTTIDARALGAPPPPPPWSPPRRSQPATSPTSAGSRRRSGRSRSRPPALTTCSPSVRLLPGSGLSPGPSSSGRMPWISSRFAPTVMDSTRSRRR